MTPTDLNYDRAREAKMPSAWAGKTKELSIVPAQDDAAVLSEKKVIDSILEKRLPAPIAEDDADEDATGQATERITRPGPVLGQPLDIAPEEQIKAYSDVYGHLPPEIELRERRIAALEGEVKKLPRDQRRALDKALKRNPMLFVSSQHAKLMVQDEYFDPQSDARRLAWYWQQREVMFGKRAFSDGVFTQSTYSDYLRYYDKCAKILSDPDADADEDALHLASEYVRCVHRTKIAAMDRLIESASPEDKAALMEAWERSPELFASDEHKLQFLRCEDFVEVKAAERMLRYWKAKKLFFGDDAFHRPVVMGDMTSHIFDLEQLGVNRVMPGTDSHGRGVVVLFLRDIAKEGWTEDGFARYVWYVIQVALEREECQRNGVVLLGDCRNLTRDEYEKIGRYRLLIKTITLTCAPLKVKALHVFYGSDVWWQSLFVSAFATITGILTSRAVIHVGSNEENMSALANRFGILADTVPTEMGGEVSCDSWTKWLEGRRSKGL